MRSTVLLLLSTLTYFSLNAIADEDKSLSFVPSIAFQYKQLDFQQFQSSGTPYHAGFRANLPTMDLALSTTYKKVFMTIKYNRDIIEDSTGTSETDTHNGYFYQTPGSDLKVGREDKNITLGYNVWNKLNVFAGFMSGKTTLTPTPVCSIPGSPSCTTPSSSINLAWYRQLITPGLPAYQQIYTESGPYLGASYAWQIGDTGTLSASVAHAKMRANYHDNLDVFNLNFNYNGNSTGNSLGLTWTAPLGESTAYFFDLRQQSYSMTATNSNNSYANHKVQTDETMSSLTAGVEFFF